MRHPDWAIEHRKPGTELRCIRGHYYLYEVTSRWNPQKKRAQKITGKFLGKITEKQGLISPSPPRRLTAEQLSRNLQVKEYGASQFIFNSYQEILVALKKYFPQESQQIAAAAFLRLLYQSPLKNMHFHLSHSFLSESNEELSLAPKVISDLLRTVGVKRDKMTAFFKSFIQPGGHLLVDLTNIHSYSDYLSIAKAGYNNQMNFEPQVNLLLIFSTELMSPAYYRIIPGNIRDVKAFKLSLKESGIVDAVIIADKGFYSDSNVLQLDESQLKYILPLKRNNTIVDYSSLEKPSRKGMDGYFKFNNRHIWYYCYTKNNKTIFVFLDETLKNCEEKDYLNRIETHPESYTFDKFQKLNIAFGTLTIMTNLSQDAQQIYSTYKSRMDIELVADTLKNLLHADRTYMRDEYALEGWMFINYIALLWYYRIYQLLMQHQLLSKYSPKDLLLHLSEIKKIKIDQAWYLAETTLSTQKLLQKLNIHIT